MTYKNPKLFDYQKTLIDAIVKAGEKFKEEYFQGWPFDKYTSYMDMPVIYPSGRSMGKTTLFPSLQKSEFVVWQPKAFVTDDADRDAYFQSNAYRRTLPEHEQRRFDSERALRAAGRMTTKKPNGKSRRERELERAMMKRDRKNAAYGIF